jgi:Hydantoinase/oxoprolinase N-terminal region
VQIGLDIGGTFTDIVALDGDGRLALTKVPSTPKDLLEGIGTATRSILAITGAEPRMVLGRVPSITALRTDDGRVWPTFTQITRQRDLPVTSGVGEASHRLRRSGGRPP